LHTAARGALMAPMAELTAPTRQQKITSGKCDRQAFAASWFIARTIVRARGKDQRGSEAKSWVPVMEPFRLWPVIGRSYLNPEIKMRHLIVAVCCAAFMGSMSGASAQTTGSAGQQVVKAGDPMNANAKMKKKPKAKKAMAKPDDGMKKDTK
jgi:hypothetical protein